MCFVLFRYDNGDWLHERHAPGWTNPTTEAGQPMPDLRWPSKPSSRTPIQSKNVYFRRLKFLIFFKRLDLHFSGKNVLGQKSELQKALEKHKRTQNQKEIEQQKNSCRTPFERMIEERAKKIETVFYHFMLFSTTGIFYITYIIL